MSQYGQVSGNYYLPKPKFNSLRSRYDYKVFSPLDLNPALWLDADDSSTLTLVSGAVSEWRDKSGNNRHATQATAGNRPLLVANGLNGTDVVRFNGSTNFLIHPYTEGSNSTWFVVANKLSTKSGGQGLFFATAPNTVSHNAIWVESATTSQQWASYAGASFQDSGVIVNTLFRLLCTVSPSGNPIQLFTDGSLSFTTTSSVRYGGDDKDRRRIGNEHTTRFSHCDISQIIIFPRVLTQAERELVEGYLAWSTGLQGNLPVGHPYKNNRPWEVN